MLFQLNRKCNKKFLFTFLQNNNYFFVFNVKTYKEMKILYNIFMGSILHSKQLINLFLKKYSLDLFGGNTFFCFVNDLNFFDIYLNIIFNLNKYNLDLIGICYNGYFLNLNLKVSNITNVLYSNFTIVIYQICIVVNLFFFKLL
jgi:hypothetical protein